MKKMVVSSFSALIDEEEAIEVSTMLEIERIRNDNTIFVVATNRPYQDVLEYNFDFPFLDYIISLNGSYIYDVKKSKSLLKKKISKSQIKAIFKKYNNYNYYFYSEDKIYNDITEVEEDIYKIEIESPTKIRNLLKEEDLDIISFIRDNKYYLEITSSNINNTIAIEKIAQKCKVSLENITLISTTGKKLPAIKNVKNNFRLNNNSIKKLLERV